METWELIARESIRDIVARYNACGDSGRIEEMMQLFTSDATLEVAGEEPCRGCAAISEFFNSVATPDDAFPLTSLHHHTATLLIDVEDQQSARARCYFSVYTQHGLDHWGRYVDQYRVVENRWLIDRRRVFVDGFTPGGWGEWRRKG